ncbi:MAG: Homoserine dehydrogenase [Candidatus Magnetoglobus multicellularis str. Araruama]|uniref:Homoserine dehydrogenase n=1 Tax=Candidatus Magnetoglobus multicellularis str. Araruama TaxID=890399 RepID=A0A1V1PFK6_9BACT|nr:MAG: Homoserine dehydrogenase [Candidatus Magnetoglobus multicellularis str. Araruama]
MNHINIGILGFGTVGTGVVRLLNMNESLLTERLGVKLCVRGIADIDTQTDRGITLPDNLLTTDAYKVINDPEIDIIVETIGGETVAKEFILAAMSQGKHVVTANKALLAKQGNAVIKKAQESSVDFAFEASVGGCMPIIKTLRESLSGNKILGLNGILNGTCNYILSKISNEGISYEAALAQAQQKGYAEADPALDINGDDTAHKLSIITALAYGMHIQMDDIFTEGITRITPMDIQFAHQFGYCIKLLAIAKMNDQQNAVEARVHPTMIPYSNMLSNVNDSYNAISIVGDAIGEMVLYGHGAGMMPTASAVVSDIVDIARNSQTSSKNRIPILAYQSQHIQQMAILPIEEISCRFYFRFTAVDSPGVLSRIAGILGDHDISIDCVHQKGRKSKQAVPIVMLTHQAKEFDVRKALSQIQSLDVVWERPMFIRIED